MKNNTRSAGGLIIFSIGWPPKVYRYLRKQAKIQKRSMAQVVIALVEKDMEDRENKS